jgi:hypothetical protein
MVLSGGPRTAVPPIVVATGSSGPERYAASELALHLAKITGNAFEVITNDHPPARAILVGAGPGAKSRFPSVSWGALGPEDVVIETAGDTLLLAGGRPRGTLHAASAGVKPGCFAKTDTAFLGFKPLAAADALLGEAVNAVSHDPILSVRARLARLPVGYVVLARWEALRKECADQGAQWPWGDSRKAFAAAWGAVAEGVPDQPWTRVTQINEGGLTPAKFLARFDKDP